MYSWVRAADELAKTVLENRHRVIGEQHPHIRVGGASGDPATMKRMAIQRLAERSTVLYRVA